MSKQYKWALAIALEFEERCSDISPEEYEFGAKGEDLRRWFSSTMYTALLSKACSSVTLEEINALVDKHKPETEQELYQKFREGLNNDK